MSKWIFVSLSLLSHGALAASTVTLSPETPSAGEWVSIAYDPEGGPLSNSNAIYVYRAFNGWAAIAGPDQKMEWDEEDHLYRFGYHVPGAAFQIDFVFHDSEDNWDNNGGSDWHVPVTLFPSPPKQPVSEPSLDNASYSGVMMQGFYWNVLPGNWYNDLAEQASQLRNMRSGHGIDRIWLPPPSKSNSGPFSMGYDPFDYYDLGQYAQKGTVRTRFGTQEELKAALQAFREEGILCMADIVLNHRSGGEWELNPLTGASAWTDFSAVASGRAIWDYEDFHPSSLQLSDEGVFPDFPDVCHVAGAQSGDPRYDFIEWGNWIMDTDNAGFQGGWRFDYVKGVDPSMIRDFRSGTGNPFSVIECWDGMAMIEANLRVCPGVSAFDFPAYYTFIDVLNAPSGGGDLSFLVDPERVLAAKHADKAVTFVANHDTDELVRNRMLAYAFILSFEGYPCIFWSDYFDRGLADLGGQEGNGIDALVWARGALAGGKPKIEILCGDDPDLLVYGCLVGSSAHPGYVVAINDDYESKKTVQVRSENPFLKGIAMKPYAWYSYANGQNVELADFVSETDGSMTFEVPARGYVLYGPQSLARPVIHSENIDGSGELMTIEIWNTLSGKRYRLQSYSRIEKLDTWVDLAEFTGGDSDRTEVEVSLAESQANLFRVVTANNE